MEFLGFPMTYWIELQKRMNERPDSLGASALLKEVIELRGLVDYYESRAEEMHRARRVKRN